MCLSTEQEEMINIISGIPSEEDLKITMPIAELNHRYIANLHNLKMRIRNNETNIDDITCIKKLVKSLVISFIDVDYQTK